MKEAKIKAGNYCAYQERTQQEVRDKLYELGLHRDEVEDVLAELITEDFVNEERYAKTFASGRFRLKQWGRRKIIYELKNKGLSPYCIDQAMKEINDDEYEATIVRLIHKKTRYDEANDYLVKNKTARFLIGKGYEPEIVWAVINDHL